MAQLIHDILNKSDVFISLLSLGVAVLSMAFGIIALLIQRSHNKKSVMPLGFISLADYENRLCIKVTNNGTGPMIIEKVSTFQTKNKSNAMEYPVDWFANMKIVWSTYRKSLENFTIAANSHSELLEYVVNEHNENPEELRNQIRGILSELTICVEYKDIYGKRYVMKRELNWFARNRKSENLPPEIRTTNRKNK